MKLEIEAKEMTLDDLKNVSKFFADYWKDRKDVCFLQVVEGTQDCSCEEIKQMMSSVFEDRPHYMKIIKDEASKHAVGTVLNEKDFVDEDKISLSEDN